MTRWDKPSARVVPPRKAKRLTVGEAELGRMEQRRAGYSQNQKRLLEIERLIEFRRGYQLTEDDPQTDEEAYLRAALPTLLYAMHEPGCPPHRRSMEAWIARSLPSLIDSPRWRLDEIWAEFTTERRPKPRRADALGRDLSLTFEERETLGITQFMFVGGTPEVRAALKREKDRARKTASRRAAGAMDRLTYEADSATDTEPWQRLGISRRTWERRRLNTSVASASANEQVDASASANASVASASALSTKGTGRSGRTCVTGQDHQPGQPAEPQERSDPLAHAAPAACPSGEDPGPGRTPARRAHPADRPEPPTVQPHAPIGEPSSNHGPTLAGGRQAGPTPAAAVTLPLQPADAVQLSILAEPQADAELRAACEVWESGPTPEAIVTGYVAATRRRAVRQIDVAQAIGISRPQLSNAMQRTFNLSSDVIARLKAWLLADDRDLKHAGGAPRRAPRPHHRRGGKRKPDPGPALPVAELRLFRTIEGSGPSRARAIPDASQEHVA